MASGGQPAKALDSLDSPPLYGMPMPFLFLGPDDERTFQYEETLPSLPIPPLDQTLKKYLDSGKLDTFIQSGIFVHKKSYKYILNLLLKRAVKEYNQCTIMDIANQRQYNLRTRIL